jgi:hypothetical protein
VTLRRTGKRFYVYPASEPPVHVRPAVPGLALVPIDRLFVQTERENRQGLLGEIAWMWPGTREQAVVRFLEHGLGSAAVVENRIVCWCTAEYVGVRRCGIGVETIEAYQRRGVATSTTAHFVAAALRRGLTPHWECDTANLPSVRVAEKVGFRPVEEAVFWAGLLPAG